MLWSLRRSGSIFRCILRHLLPAQFLPALCLVMPLGSVMPLGPATASEHEVVLQLRWDHQFQFAGLYAAHWQGYYEEAGLAVELRPAFAEDGRLIDVTEAVETGRAQFGIGAADILLARAEGADFVVLASLFQHSAVTFFARTETQLETLSDLSGLRVVRRTGDLVDVEFQVMLAAEGIDPDLIAPAPFTVREGYLADLAAGRVDMMPGYIIGTLHDAMNRGLELTTLSPRTYGIDFYGDSLFTTRAFAEGNPELVERFVSASLRGWHYALENPEAIINRIVETYRPAFPIDDYRAFLEFQVEPVAGLVQPFGEAVEIGHVNPQRWRRMHELLAGAGLIAGEDILGGFDADGFVFEAEAYANRRRAAWLSWLQAGGLAMSGVALTLAAMLWTLRRSVARATGTLRETQAHLSALIEASPEAMLVLERDGTCVKLNSQAASRLGRTVDACIGGNPFDWLPPAVAAGRRAKLEQAIDTGAKVRFQDERLGRTLDHIVVPAINAAGPTGRAAIFSRDVTEWRQKEQELCRAWEEADQANRAKSEFVAIMAHELRTPLNAINGFSEVMTREVFGPLGEPHYEAYAHHINSSGQHLLALINDLLDLSTIEAGRMQVSCEEIGIAEAIEAGLAFVRERAASKRITLTTAPDPAVPVLLADSRALKQMLVNLLSNAVKFTPSGGRIGVASQGLIDGSLALSVSDTGPGIAAEDLEIVLKPFHQGRAGRRNPERGSGLGLTLVKSLVELHGGRLELDSRPGAGTKASLVFPADRTRPAARPASRAEPQANIG